MSQMHNPCHPGEVLKQALSGISVTDVAKRLGVGRVALSRLLNGATGISPETALRLLLMAVEIRVFLAVEAFSQKAGMQFSSELRSSPSFDKKTLDSKRITLGGNFTQNSTVA